ncbi:MAG: hypothetical protein CM15mP95_0300 [Alphaproteobacteria bacterium]|nr:MAG: hypothetical protein CM15mP95_0300 [Alphaproteobacteria bacterium]
MWPDLDVQLISITESWAQYAVAGPNARKLLRKIVDTEFDISNEAFPFMACGVITVFGGLRADYSEFLSPVSWPTKLLCHSLW